MNRRNILSLSAITALGLAMLPGNAVAQTKSLKDQLVGTWTLVSWEQTLPNGGKLQRYGTNPKGIGVFDTNGRFYIIQARPDLQKIASNNPSTPTPEEAKAIVAGSIALFGTYTVDEAKKIVNLQLEASTFANQVGTDQKRTIVSITTDEMKYSFEALSGGPILSSWRRAK